MIRTASLALIFVFATACNSVVSTVDAGTEIDATATINDAAPGNDAAINDAAPQPDAPPVADAALAPLTPWGPPQLVSELNSSTLSDFKPTVRGDLLELFFYRPGPAIEGGMMTFRSTRASVGNVWSTPAPDGGLGNNGVLEISADGTEMYKVGSLSQIWRSVRPSPKQGWSAFSFQFIGMAPTLSGDGLTIYFVNDQTKEIEKRSRATLGSAWGSAVSVGLPGNPLYNASAVSRDERVIVLSGPENVGQVFNIEFTRMTTASAWTGPTEVTSLTTVGAANCNLATAYTMYCGMENPANGTGDIYRLQRQ